MNNTTQKNEQQEISSALEWAAEICNKYEAGNEEAESLLPEAMCLVKHLSAALSRPSAIRAQAMEEAAIANPLEWQDQGRHNIWWPPDSQFAQFGCLEHSVGPAGFQVYQDSEGWETTFWHGNRGHGIGTFLTRHAAKEAAQKHAEKLVSSVSIRSLASQPVQDGYVLVPVEPTDAMLQAAWDSCSFGDETTYRECWKAMLSAAPTAAQRKGG